MSSALDGIGIDSVIKAAESKKADQDKLGQNQFLEMLVAQLQNQDPLNPQDSADFAAQLAQFSTVEQLIAMRTGIDDMVAAFKEQNATGGSNLDPASLVGREVVVVGSQVEVDKDGSRISLPLRNTTTAEEATIKLIDAKGNVVIKRSLLPVGDDGRLVPLAAGDHTFELDPAAENLPPGVYKVEISATDAAKKPVTILPMVTGIVSGAVLAGDEPAIRIGGRYFGLDQILELRLAPGSSTTGSSSSSSSTATDVGGGQSVSQPTGGRTAS